MKTWKEKVQLIQFSDSDLSPTDLQQNGEENFLQAWERLQLRIRSNIDDLRLFIENTKRDGDLSDSIQMQGIEARNKFQSMKKQVGLSFKPVDNVGLQVTKLNSNEAAEIAGIKINDIIEMVGSVKTVGNDDFTKAIADNKPGDLVPFQTKRRNDNNQEYNTITINVVIGAENYTIEEVKSIRNVLDQFNKLEQNSNPILSLAPEYAVILRGAQRALSNLEHDYKTISLKMETLQKAMVRRSFIHTGMFSGMDYLNPRSKPIIMFSGNSTSEQSVSDMSTFISANAEDDPLYDSNSETSSEEESEDPEEQEEFEEKVCDRFIDYFFVIEIMTKDETDVKDESDAKGEGDAKSETATKSDDKDSFRTRRYPATDYDDFPLPDQRHIIHYALLSGIQKKVIRFDDEANQSDANQKKFRELVSQHHYFAYTITNQTGDKCYVMCMYYYTPRLGSTQIYGAKCICLLSHYPFYTLFFNCLRQLYEIEGKTIGLTDQAPVQILQLLTQEIPLPIPGGSPIQFSLGSQQLTCFLPSPKEFPLFDLDLRMLFKWLSVEDIVSIITHLLVETRLLVHSTELYKLSIAIPCLLSLLFPFRWQAPMICEQLITASQVTVLDAPVTYIIGSHSEHVQGGEIDLPETIIINLDEGTVKYPPAPFQKVSFPAQQPVILTNALHTIVNNQRKKDIQQKLNAKRKEIIFGPGSFGLTWINDIITDVKSDGRAQQAGVQLGWRIISVNGKLHCNDGTLIKQNIDETKENGKNTSIIFDPNGVITKVFAPKRIGFSWSGNLVTSVDPSSQASVAGVQVGWHIIIVNGKIQSAEGSLIQTHIQETKNQGKDTTITFKTPARVKITARNGCAIREKPVRNARTEKKTIQFNEVVEYVDQKQIECSGYNVTFYKLAGGQGWIANRNLKNPGADFEIEEIQEISENQNMQKYFPSVIYSFNSDIRNAFLDVYKYLLSEYRKCLFFLGDVPVFNAEAFFDLHRQRKSQALEDEKQNIDTPRSYKILKIRKKGRTKAVRQKPFLIQLLETQLFACFLEQSQYPNAFHEYISERQLKSTRKSGEFSDQIRMTPDDRIASPFIIDLAKTQHLPKQGETKELDICNWVDISDDIMSPRDFKSSYFKQNEDSYVVVRRPKTMVSGIAGEDLHSFVYFIILSSFQPTKKLREQLDRKRNMCIRTLSRRKSRKYFSTLLDQTANNQSKKIPLQEMQFQYLRELVMIHLDKCSKREDFANAVPTIIAGTQFYYNPKKERATNAENKTASNARNKNPSTPHSHSGTKSKSGNGSRTDSVSMSFSSDHSRGQSEIQPHLALEITGDREVYLESSINKHPIFKLMALWDTVFEIRLGKLKARNNNAPLDYIHINDLVSSVVNEMIKYGQDTENVVNFCGNKCEMLKLSTAQTKELKTLSKKLAQLSDYNCIE